MNSNLGSGAGSAARPCKVISFLSNFNVVAVVSIAPSTYDTNYFHVFIRFARGLVKPWRVTSSETLRILLLWGRTLLLVQPLHPSLLRVLVKALQLVSRQPQQKPTSPSTAAVTAQTIQIHLDAPDGTLYYCGLWAFGYISFRCCHRCPYFTRKYFSFAESSPAYFIPNQVCIAHNGSILPRSPHGYSTNRYDEFHQTFLAFLPVWALR